MTGFKNSLVPIFLLSLVCSSYSSLSLAATKTPKIKTTESKNEVRAIEDTWGPNFDDLLDRDSLDLLDSRISSHYPRMNIQDSGDSYHIEAELPGIKKSDIEIKLKDNNLVISGEKKSELEENKKNYRLIERANGAFYRSVSLPKDINKDKITAELKDGILEVDIAKTKNAPKPVEKKILIE